MEEILKKLHGLQMQTMLSESYVEIDINVSKNHKNASILCAVFNRSENNDDRSIEHFYFYGSESSNTMLKRFEMMAFYVNNLMK